MKLSDLTVSSCNVRQPNDEDDLSALVRSIRSDGLLSKVVLRPAEGGGAYEVVAGHRRYLSLLEIHGGDYELDESEYVVKGGLSDDEAFLVSISENQLRRDLSLMELCNAALRLNQRGIGDKQAAEILNISMARLKRVQTLKQDSHKMPEEARQELAKPAKESRFTDAHWEKVKKADDPDIVRDAVEYIMSHESPARDIPGILTGIERRYNQMSGGDSPGAPGGVGQAPEDTPAEDALAAGKAIIYSHKGDLTLVERDGGMSFKVAGKGEDEEIPFEHYLEYLRHPDRFKCSVTLKFKVKPIG